MDAKPFEQWAIVEIFGHTRLAGLVSEASIGGCSFVRVDVPESADGTRQAFTRYYGQGAIYSLTIVTEPVARAAAEEMRVRGVNLYDIPKLLPQTASVHDDYSQEEDEREEDDEFF
jgi:hypothetical protein